FGSPASMKIQVALTILTVLGMVVVMLAPFFIADGAQVASPASATPSNPAFGLAMILVLIHYGGWNETACLSAELRDAKQNMVYVLVIGTVILVAVYIAVNLAFLA